MWYAARHPPPRHPSSHTQPARSSTHLRCILHADHICTNSCRKETEPIATTARCMTPPEKQSAENMHDSGNRVPRPHTPTACDAEPPQKLPAAESPHGHHAQATTHRVQLRENSPRNTITITLRDSHPGCSRLGRGRCRRTTAAAPKRSTQHLRQRPASTPHPQIHQKIQL